MHRRKSRIAVSFLKGCSRGLLVPPVGFAIQITTLAMSAIADPLRCLALAVLEHAIQELARSGRPAELLQPVIPMSPARPAGADSAAISTPFDRLRATLSNGSASASRRAQYRYAANAQRWLLEDTEMVQAWCRLAGISARRYYRAACGRLNRAGHPNRCIERALATSLVAALEPNTQK